MSTTRKIEGLAHEYAERNFSDDGDTRLVTTDSFSATRPGSMYTKPATLIIGGKGYTHDEVVALLVEVRSDYIIDEDKQWLTECAAKHGITL